MFDTLCDTIAAGDARLCRWMAQGSLPEREATTREARVLIAALEKPREALARHTAEQLLAWLGYKGVALFTLKTDALGTRIRHAGLDPILAQLRAPLPPHGKRVRIGRVLCSCGARPEPVRHALELTSKEVKGTHPAALARLLLDQLAGDPAEAWQQVAMINRRFGYDATHPAWTGMRLPRSLRPQMAKLEQLRHAPEAKYRGLALQLP